MKTMLEQKKKMDEAQQDVVETRRATLSMYHEMCGIGVIVKVRIMNFIESASKYSGNPKKVFDWCENLETQMINYEWETIPNEAVKLMLWSCITDQLEKR